jgi:hypothetical protein
MVLADANRCSSASTAGGFWLVTQVGRMISYGGAPDYGSGPPGTPFVGGASAPGGCGYWLVSSEGRVYGFGDAPSLGGLGTQPLASPVIGMAGTVDGRGYWLATAAGAVYNFGDAAAPPPARPSTQLGAVVAIVADPATGGYWLATSTGVVRGYDGAPSYGGARLPSPVVAMAATPDGRGYWALAQDGRTATFGDARRHGAPNGACSCPIVGMASAPTGGGYWLVSSDGHIFTYGDATKVTRAPGRHRVVAIIAANPVVTAPSPPSVAPAAVAYPALSQVPMSVTDSQNWSGYMATGGPYTSVSGAFTVPSVSLAAPAQDMVSEWVGLDGSSGGSLLQAGVTVVPVPGSPGGPEVYAWWEVLPAPCQPVTAMAVKPGDEVSIAIDQVGGDGWVIHLDDGTNGQGDTQNVSYGGPGASAEWIVEAPTDTETRQPLPLAPYTPAVEFTNLSATGTSSAMTDLVMAQSGQTVSVPSPLTPAGFSVAYAAAGPPAPAPAATAWQLASNMPRASSSSSSAMVRGGHKVSTLPPPTLKLRPRSRQA